MALAALVSGPAVGQAVGPNAFYGVVGTHFPSEVELGRAATAGAGVFRAQVDWKFVEPTPGARDYYGTDVLFGFAARQGITILPDLLGSPAGCPATQSGRRSSPQRNGTSSAHC